MSWRDRKWAGSGEGETFRPSGKPVGTIWILAVTAGFLVFMWSVGGGNQGSGTRSFMKALEINGADWWQPWRYLTYALVHLDLGHLIRNALMIGVAGWILEQGFGTARFVRIYLGIVAFAGLFGYVIPALIMNDPVGCVGASGGALGLVVLLGVKHPRMTLHVWGIIPVRCWILAVILVAYDLFSIAGRYDSNVAHGVHLAGALAGGFVGFVLPRVDDWAEDARTARERRREAREREQQAAEQGELDRILAKIQSEGMDQITETERKFLKRQSEKLKSGGRR